ncbi:hypothetical protein HOB10_00685 [Candidatus Parcubacteria bacterium]|jgi:hypothetical protein|nr:hypothetical protein [Candidatus Parcubacteria bacterium]
MNEFQTQYIESNKKPEDRERLIFLALSQLLRVEDLNSNIEKNEEEKRSET